ncbi:hypothetical protein JCM19239_1548 [Vibrio variabilis]|uniref:Uncharacterized protein n=1 Tax=Vibrio variabilis TaxID=990271 RepID=A0ABQ0JI99_9VIBR|nr:hypothetical protein JCM19239_1548 [Vibrio variabilis]
MTVATEIERFICMNQYGSGCGCSDYSISRYSSNAFYALINAENELSIRALMANFETA